MKRGFLSVLFCFCLICICQTSFSQETLSIVTYYPAPFGVYRELRVLGNNNARIQLGVVNDAGNNAAGIVIADNPPNPGHPQIQFQNHAFTAGANTPDFIIVQLDNDNLWFSHEGNNNSGQYTFATTNASSTRVPATIRTGDIYRCTTY